MQNAQDEMKHVLTKKLQILVTILFALSMFLFTLLILILVTYSVYNSLNSLMVIASVLSLLATWPLYRWMKKPHLKNPFIQYDLFMFIGAFITSVLGTFLGGYLTMLLWPSQLGPLPAIFFTTLPCIAMGLLLGSICWHQVFEYGEHHATMLYTYVSMGAILIGVMGFLISIYPGLSDEPKYALKPDLLFTTPCGIILGIYVGWRLWRWRYYKTI